MIEMLSSRIANYSKQIVPESQHSVAVIKYGIHVFLNTVMTIVSCYALASLTGRFLEMTIGLVSFVVLRAITGGYHLKSSIACTVVSALGANVISFSYFPVEVTVLLTMLSAVMIALWSPSKIERQTRIAKRNFPVLNLMAVMMVCCNIIIGSPIVAAAFFIQSLSCVLNGGESR